MGLSDQQDGDAVHSELSKEVVGKIGEEEQYFCFLHLGLNISERDRLN